MRMRMRKKIMTMTIIVTLRNSLSERGKLP
jgi:hypothetical protein